MSAPTASKNLLDGTFCPRIIDGVEVWPFFPAKGGSKAIYIVGDLNVDRYITIPEHAIDITRKVIQLFDGTHSIDAIEQHVRVHERLNVNVRFIYDQLAEAGLITSPAGGTTRQSDVEALMLAVSDFRLGPVPAFVRTAIRTVTPAATVMAFLIICFGSWLFFRDAAYWSARPQSAMAFPLMFLSCVLHECAHGVAATYFGLSPRRLRAAFFLGIFPFVYLRLGGLYTLGSAKRVVVWMAGIFANLTIAAMLIVMLHYGLVPAGYEHVFRTVAIGNYLLALVNLFPFLPTDGYFVAMTLFRTHNMRTRAWRALKDLLHGRWNGHSRYVLFYLTGCLLTIGFGLAQRVSSASRNQPGGVSGAIGSVLLIWFAFWTARWSHRSSAGWQQDVTRTVRWAAVCGAFYLSGLLANVIRVVSLIVPSEATGRLASRHYIVLTVFSCGVSAAMLFLIRQSARAMQRSRVTPTLLAFLAGTATAISCALLLTVPEAGAPLRALWIGGILVWVWVMTSGRLRAALRERRAQAPDIDAFDSSLTVPLSSCRGHTPSSGHPR